MILSRFLISLT